VQDPETSGATKVLKPVNDVRVYNNCITLTAIILIIFVVEIKLDP